jgi:integrase
MADLFHGIIADYQNNNCRSLATLEDRLIPLRAAFGLDRAVDVDEARIARYQADRLAEGRAAGTVNRELAALRRALRLGFKHKQISRVPDVAILAEAAPREGFVEPNQYERLHAHLPAYMQAPSRFAYLTGWRRRAVTSLRWPDIDLPNQRLYLRRASSKNSKPYVLVLTGELLALIERRWLARKVTRKDGTTFLSDYVFHRQGRAIGDFKRAWKAACLAAGFCRPGVDEHGQPVLDGKGKPVIVPTIRFHDVRRSAARNLRRAGIGPDVGMKITGHETDSMWRRYSIVSEDDIERALDATQAYVSARASQPKAAKVISMAGEGRP